METKHTPGPWRSGDKFNTVFGPKTDAPSPQVIATVAKGNEANARLISAAPELLEACKRSIELLKMSGANVDSNEPILKAIAKAEGKTNGN